MAATQPTAEAWVVSGTCGWSDDSIMRCGRFYPRGISSATDRLPHFATRFATVEIDSSTYAIPTMDRVAQWVGKTPDGFRFSIKAFGLFCNGSCPAAALPRAVRDAFPDETGGDTVVLTKLSAGAVDAIWTHFNRVVELLWSRGKLAAVLFQFNRGFRPTSEAAEHLIDCRRRLFTRAAMAVEFRSHEWFHGAWGEQPMVFGLDSEGRLANSVGEAASSSSSSSTTIAPLLERAASVAAALGLPTPPRSAEESSVTWAEGAARLGLTHGGGSTLRILPSVTDDSRASPQLAGAAATMAPLPGSQMEQTLSLLRTLNLALVASDDLQHELVGADAPMTSPIVTAPIHLHATCRDLVYVRVHRRVGTMRLLSADAIARWAARIEWLAAAAVQSATGTSDSSSSASSSSSSGTSGTAAAAWSFSPASSQASVSSTSTEPVGSVGRGPSNPRLSPPVLLFYWGTDWEDQPLLNDAALQRAMPNRYFPWAESQKAARRASGIGKFFASQKPPSVPATPDSIDSAHHASDDAAAQPKPSDSVDDDDATGWLRAASGSATAPAAPAAAAARASKAPASPDVDASRAAHSLLRSPPGKAKPQQASASPLALAFQRSKRGRDEAVDESASSKRGAAADGDDDLVIE